MKEDARRLRHPALWCTRDPAESFFCFWIIQWIVHERALFVAQPAQWACKVIWSINYVTQCAHSCTPLQQNSYLQLWKSNECIYLCECVRVDSRWERGNCMEKKGMLVQRKPFRKCKHFELPWQTFLINLLKFQTIVFFPTPLHFSNTFKYKVHSKDLGTFNETVVKKQSFSISNVFF